MRFVLCVAVLAFTPLFGEATFASGMESPYFGIGSRTIVFYGQRPLDSDRMMAVYHVDGSSTFYSYDDTASPGWQSISANIFWARIRNASSQWVATSDQRTYASDFRALTSGMSYQAAWADLFPSVPVSGAPRWSLRPWELFTLADVGQSGFSSALGEVADGLKWQALAVILVALGLLVVNLVFFWIWNRMRVSA